MQGFFYGQESKGDLTRDHYLNSPPIEPSLEEISHVHEKFRDGRVGTRTRVSGLRGNGRSPALSHPTTLATTELSGHPKLDYFIPKQHQHSIPKKIASFNRLARYYYNFCRFFKRISVYKRCGNSRKYETRKNIQ